MMDPYAVLGVPRNATDEDISYHTAERRQNAFIRLVAEKMGLTEKLAHQSQKSGVE